MKTLPAVIVLLSAVIGGRFIGLEWAEQSKMVADRRAPAAEKKELLAIAQEHADDLGREYFAAWKAKREEKSADLDSRRAAALTEGQASIARMVEIMDGTEKTVDGLAAAVGGKMDPSEYVVRRATAGFLANNLEIGRVLIGATEASVRRDGMRYLATAAEEGQKEAVELLMSLFDDADKSIAEEALSLAAGLAKKGDAERNKMLAESGLEARLVGMLAALEGNSQRRVLDALTALGNPAAVQVWRQLFNDNSARNRDVVSAARSLKDLGSPGEYDQLVLELEYDLAAEDRRTQRSAVNDLRRLGGDAAKAALQRALEAAPDSPEAETLRRTIERFDREAGQDQNPRVRFGSGAGGTGGDTGGFGNGGFGGGRGTRRGGN